MLLSKAVFPVKKDFAERVVECHLIDLHKCKLFQ